MKRRFFSVFYAVYRRACPRKSHCAVKALTPEDGRPIEA